MFVYELSHIICPTLVPSTDDILSVLARNSATICNYCPVILNCLNTVIKIFRLLRTRCLLCHTSMQLVMNLQDETLSFCWKQQLSSPSCQSLPSCVWEQRKRWKIGFHTVLDSRVQSVTDLADFSVSAYSMDILAHLGIIPYLLGVYLDYHMFILCVYLVKLGLIIRGPHQHQ